MGLPGRRPNRPAVLPVDDAVSVIEQMLERPSGLPEGEENSLGESAVEAWADAAGTLADGRTARLAASCLVQPEAGDRVLVWRTSEARWVLSIIERQNKEAVAVLASQTPISIKAPRVGITAETVQIVSKDMLTTSHNHYSVADTRTESAKLRVAQIETDIRRAGSVDDQVEGTLVQRVGTWVSNTAREARFKARTFLFD